MSSPAVRRLSVGLQSSVSEIVSASIIIVDVISILILLMAREDFIAFDIREGLKSHCKIMRVVCLRMCKNFPCISSYLAVLTTYIVLCIVHRYL
jgi:hypothetical protein